MYWTDWGDTPMIGVAAMDGTEVKPFVTDDIHWPNGLTLDWPNQRLYWLDAKTRKMESIQLNGKNRKTVLADVLKHPYGIAVFEDRIYWSDWETKSIQSCNKFSGKDREIVAKDRKVYGRTKKNHSHFLLLLIILFLFRYSYLPFSFTAS
jgi:hypothetical protein